MISYEADQNCGKPARNQTTDQQFFLYRKTHVISLQKTWMTIGILPSNVTYDSKSV
jgi:hypothetical protein